jgi:hypothetical protein
VPLALPRGLAASAAVVGLVPLTRAARTAAAARMATASFALKRASWVPLGGCLERFPLWAMLTR